MPSKSEAQRRLMAAAAHDPAFAKKVGVPQRVAREFNRADAKKRSLGTEIIGKTSQGKPVVKNPDGSVSTHRMATVGVDSGAMNLPTMYGGKRYSVQEAFKIAQKNKFVDPDTGERLQVHKSEAAARADYELRQHRQIDRDASWVLQQYTKMRKK